MAPRRCTSYKGYIIVGCQFVDEVETVAIDRAKRLPDAGAPIGPGVGQPSRVYFMDGKENWAPSRTPPVGQRWVMVLRRV